MKIKRHNVYLGLIIALIILAVFIKIRQIKSSPEITKEIKPIYGSIQNVISTTGMVQPQNRLEIKPPISGRIEEIKVKEGQKVAVGRVLAWMSSTERAALLDTARSQGEEKLRYWQDAYKPTPLIAPIDGEVIVRAVEPGQTVTSNDAVIVLSDRLIVKAQVDETDIGRVKTHQQAIIGLDAYPSIKVDGRVDHISYEATVVNNVTIYEVDILPDEIPDVFRSGMSANVDIIEKKKENALIVPIEAVGQDMEGSFVLLREGKVKRLVKHRVKLGISNDKDAEVVSGLDADDKIIIKTKRYIGIKKNKPSGSPFMPFGRKKR